MSFIFTSIRSFLGRTQMASVSRGWVDIGLPQSTKKAYFGLGCFWAPDGQFPAVTGVLRTRVGYAGGKRAGPTYRDIMDHTEVIEVEYDPESVTYDRLLVKFWQLHDGTAQMKKRQYISLVLCSDDYETSAATAAMAAAQKGSRYPIVTEIARFDRFYEAEGYHQKYYLQCDTRAMNVFGFSQTDLTNTVIAGRLNALIMGSGTEDIVNELKNCKLNEEQTTLVEKLCREGGTGAAVCH